MLFIIKLFDTEYRFIIKLFDTEYRFIIKQFMLVSYSWDSHVSCSIHPIAQSLIMQT
jgi:hypothetical protein